MYCTVKCNNENCKYHIKSNYCSLSSLILDKSGKCLYQTEKKEEEK